MTTPRLADLRAAPFTARLAGRPHPDARTQGEVLWFEVDHGHLAPNGTWSHWTTAWNSEADLSLVLDDGRIIPLPWRRLRLAILPTATLVFSGDEPDCPAPLAQWTQAHGGPVTVAEYALVAGHDYRISVQRERVVLPPRATGDAPTSTHRDVARVTDPRHPDAPLTPVFDSWR